MDRDRLRNPQGENKMNTSDMIPAPIELMNEELDAVSAGITRQPPSLRGEIRTLVDDILFDLGIEKPVGPAQ
jgi:hypothetical protein